MSIPDQIDRMLAANPTFSDDDLFVVWGGANDVLAQLSSLLPPLPDPLQASLPQEKPDPLQLIANMKQAAGQFQAGIEKLIDAGAKNVIVMTVPDINDTPLGAMLEAGALDLLALLGFDLDVCVFRSIRPPIPIASGHPLFSGCEA